MQNLYYIFMYIVVFVNFLKYKIVLTNSQS